MPVTYEKLKKIAKIHNINLTYPVSGAGIPKGSRLRKKPARLYREIMAEMRRCKQWMRNYDERKKRLKFQPGRRPTLNNFRSGMRNMLGSNKKEKQNWVNCDSFLRHTKNLRNNK